MARPLRSILFALLAAGAAAGTVSAQAPTSVDPRPFGIDLAPGPVQPGNEQLVTTNDDAGQPVVGRVHVRVGDGAVILLPDGQLVPRKAGQFAPTDRPFKPATQDDLTARLAGPGYAGRRGRSCICRQAGPGG